MENLVWDHHYKHSQSNSILIDQLSDPIVLIIGKNYHVEPQLSDNVRRYCVAYGRFLIYCKTVKHLLLEKKFVD